MFGSQMERSETTRDTASGFGEIHKKIHEVAACICQDSYIQWKLNIFWQISNYHLTHHNMSKENYSILSQHKLSSITIYGKPLNFVQYPIMTMQISCVK